MSNSKILEKKNWVVKMIVLDAKDAEISDISHIKMYDDSSKNSTIATKKVRNGKTEKKSSDTQKKATSDAETININSKGSATRKEPRARTAHSKAENVFVQRNLRSSNKNAAIGPTISETNMWNRSMPGLSDGEPIKKEMGKMLKQSPEKGKVSVSDPLSSVSDSGALAERFSKTTQECGPSMPELFNDLNASGISPRKNTSKFDHENFSEKIKKRRFTIDHFTTNRQRLVQPPFQDGENISKSKGFRQEITTGGKTNTPSSDLNDPHRELLESLAQGRKHFFENFTRN